MNIKRKHLTIAPVVAAVFLVAGATAGFAGPRHGRSDDETAGRIQQELSAIVEDEGSTRLGDLSVDDLMELAGRLSVREQEGRYVERMRRRSFFLPGLGQFGTDDPLEGSLFLGGHIALKAGTLVGSYVLLPESVKIGGDGLDYFGDSFSDIRSAWGNLSFSDVLPSLGVLTGGTLLQTAYRFWAAGDAGNRARRNIEDGTVQFEPQPLKFVGDQLGFGATIRY